MCTLAQGGRSFESIVQTLEEEGKGKKKKKKRAGAWQRERKLYSFNCAKEGESSPYLVSPPSFDPRDKVTTAWQPSDTIQRYRISKPYRLPRQSASWYLDLLSATRNEPRRTEGVWTGHMMWILYGPSICPGPGRINPSQWFILFYFVERAPRYWGKFSQLIRAKPRVRGS